MKKSEKEKRKKKIIIITGKITEVMENMKRVKVETHEREKINKAIHENEMRKHLYETHENYENRKMREYCKTHKITNTHGNRKVNYYAVNRGIHTIEWQRENWKEPAKENRIEMKNKIVLIYENEMGIVELARTIKQLNENEYEIELQKLRNKIIIGKRKNELNLPDKIMIDKEIYTAKELWKMLIENKVEVFELS